MNKGEFVMSIMSLTYICKNCGNVLKENDMKCDHCGSVERNIDMYIQETISGCEKRIDMKVQNKEERLGHKHKEVDQLVIKTEKYHDVDRMVTRTIRENRRDDIYSEFITDLETGYVYKDAVEPLSEHKGHGSAKNDFKRQK